MKRRRLYLPDLYHERSISNGYVVATFLMFHRRAIETISRRKLYDDIFLYGEELFWCAEWRKLGFRLLYTPQKTVMHLVGQSSPTKSDYIFKLRNAYQAWGEYLFLRRRYTKFTLAFFYAIRLVRLGMFSYNKPMRRKFLITIELVTGSLKAKYHLKP